MVSATVNRIAFVVAIFLIAGLYPAGCGKKGPPVPPEIKIPPPVSDILLTRDKNQVIVSWSIPQSLKIDQYHSWTAVVYRAVRSIQETPCKNCPLMFVKINELPISQSSLPDRKMKYEHSIEAGNRYWYKIVLVSDGGFSTKDSDMVSVEGEP